MFGELLKENPDRYLPLTALFGPATHQRPVAEAFQAAAGAGVPLASLEKLVGDFHHRGFSTLDFRSQVAYALASRVRRGEELNDAICAILEGWLADPESGADTSEPSGDPRA